MRTSGRAARNTRSGGHRSQGRIVIADEAPLFLDGLKAAIGEHFEIVGEAATSREVLSLLSRHQPRLLLAGFRLACGRDALGLGPEFRSRCQETATVVFLPRNAFPFTGRLLDAGFRGILARCAPRQSLLPAIKKVIAGEVFLDPRLSTLDPRPSTLAPRPDRRAGGHLHSERPRA